METYLNELDLVMYYDTDVSPVFKKYRKDLMATCKLIIEDEVNIKLEGLEVDVRRKENAPKFEVSYARYMPNTNLGDGMVRLLFWNWRYRICKSS